MQKQAEKSFLQGALVLGVGTIVVKIIGALFKIPLASVLDPTGLSYFVTAYDLFTPIYALSVAGFPVAVSKLVSENISKGRYKDARRVLKISVKMFVIIGILGSVILLLGAKALVGIVNNPSAFWAVIAIAPALFFGCLTSAYRGYYQGFSNMVPTAISQIIEASVKLILGLSLSFLVLKIGIAEFDMYGTVFGKTVADVQSAQLAVMPFAAAAAITGVMISTLCGTIYLWLRHKIKGDTITQEEIENSPKPKSMKLTSYKILSTAIPICLSALVVNLSVLIDLSTIMNRLSVAINDNLGVILEMYQGILPDVLAVTDIPTYLHGSYEGYAISIFNLIPSITTTIGISTLPIIAAAWATHDKKSVKKNVESVLKITSMIAIPAGLGIVVLARPILEFLFRGEQAARSIAIAAPMLTVLGFGVIFLALSTPINSMFNAIGRVDLPVKFMLIGCVIKVISNFILVAIPEINIKGAPIGTFLCYFVTVVLSVSTLCKLTKIRLNFTQIFFKPFICGLLCAIAAYASYGLLSRRIDSTFVVILSIGIGGIIYIISVFCTNTLTKSDVLLLPKGEKIAQMLEKYSILS